MKTPQDVVNKILEIAPSISNRQLSRALYQPDADARPSCCFTNVEQKVARDGSEIVFGWFFLHRINREFGEYIIATHHAVWLNHKHYLIDVTPFESDPKHQPFGDGECILFLPDDNAFPVHGKNVIAPLPNKFFALSDNEEIKDYIAQLANAEDGKCQKIYNGEFNSERIMGVTVMKHPTED